MFKDVKKLRPGKPQFAYFLAVDIQKMAKNMSWNLKELFLGQDKRSGSFDGKMSLGEFAEFVDRAWGEDRNTTMEKPPKRTAPGVKPKKGAIIKR
jgi:hypothetical protein